MAGAFACRYRRYRHYEPARDHRRLGQGIRENPYTTLSSGSAGVRAAECDRAAFQKVSTEYIKEKTGLLHRRLLLRYKAAAGLLDHVPGARRPVPQQGDLLFGTIDTWLIWKLDRRQGPCDGLFQRRAHDALRHQHARLGRGNSGRAEHPALHAAKAAALQRPVRHDRPVASRRRNSDHRRGGRPAGGPLRPDLLPARRGQKYLWYGLLPADEHGRKTGLLAEWPRHHDRLGPRREGDLRARRIDLRRRRGHPVAARRDEADRERGGVRGGRAGGRGHERLLRCPGVHGPWRPLLGSICARRDRRPDARL